MNGIHVIDKYGAKRYLLYFLIHIYTLWTNTVPFILSRTQINKIMAQYVCFIRILIYITLFTGIVK